MLSAYQIKSSLQSSKMFLKKQMKEHLSLDLEQKGSGFQSYNSRDNKNENTLGLLTQKFVKLIQAAPDQIIQIDEASLRLGIQKRRIYDITNVLEGIGYIEKLGKNKMKWVGGERGSELENKALQLQQKHKELELQTKKVESQIEDMKNELIRLSNENKSYNFLRVDDIVKVMKGLQVSQMLIYAGGIGDQVENDSNPQKKTSQCTIESNNSSTKFYFCRLLDNSELQIIENGDQAEQEAKVGEKEHKYEAGKGIFKEHSSSNSAPEQTPEIVGRVNSNFDMNAFEVSSESVPLSSDSVVKERQQFFQSDEDK